MKKLLALVLVGIMTFSLLGCGKSGSTSSSESSAVKKTASEDASSDKSGETADVPKVSFAPGKLTVADSSKLPKHKIAFSYYAFTDKLGLQFKASIQYLCNAYNCEAVFYEFGANTDEQVTNTESVLAAGDIDGLIFVGATPSVVAVAQKYKVPYVSVCGFPSLEKEVQALAGYDCFLGAVVDDDVWAGKQAMQALYDAGCRNVCFSGVTQGLVKSHDDRAQAYREFIKSHNDMKSLAESLTMMETANDISTFAASFAGIMDGIFFSAGSDAIYLTMETEGITDGSVKVAAVDVSSQTGTYLKKGTQIWACGGQYGTAEMGFAILYSYLADGTRLIKDVTKPVTRQYLEIKNYNDYEKYCKYVESDVPVYTADEIAAYIPYFTKGVTIANYEAEAVNYSLDSLASRRK